MRKEGSRLMKISKLDRARAALRGANAPATGRTHAPVESRSNSDSPASVLLMATPCRSGKGEES